MSPHLIHHLVLARPFLPNLTGSKQTWPTRSEGSAFNTGQAHSEIFSVLYSRNPLSSPAQAEGPHSSFLHMLSLAKGLIIKKSAIYIPFKQQYMCLAKYCAYHELWEPVFIYSEVQASYKLNKTGFAKTQPYICDIGRHQLTRPSVGPALWTGAGRISLADIMEHPEWPNRATELVNDSTIKKSLYGAPTAEEFLLDILGLADKPTNIHDFNLAVGAIYKKMLTSANKHKILQAAISLTYD